MNSECEGSDGSRARARGGRLPRLAALAAALLAFSLLPSCAPVTSAPEAPLPATVLVDLEWRFHTEINRHRATLGLPPLSFRADVAQIARDHSRAMARAELPFGHAAFDRRVAAVSHVLPYRRLAENLAANNYPRQFTVTAAVEALLQSSGHRPNIEGQFDVTGVGVARNTRGEYYFTQLFVERR
jgi:uncharacterized protein YkwD